LERYERMRARASATVSGQLALANWCAENEYPLQERAHLTRVLLLAPEHAEARARLGYLRGSEGWVHAGAIWQGFQNAARVSESIDQWRSELADIRSGLSRRSESARQFAMDRLMAIRDTSASPAIEVLLASESRAMAHLAVKALGNMTQHEVSLALARIAVFSPWADVHQAASEELRQRPREGYVPALLSEMSTPIESRYQIARVGCNVYYRHAFVRERQGDKQYSVMDFQHVRLRPRQVGRDEIRVDPSEPNPDFSRGLHAIDGLASWHARDALADFYDGRDESRLVLLHLLPIVQQREAQRLVQNGWVHRCNERIRSVLTKATGQGDLQTPQQWWDWWNDENQVAQAGSKYCNLRYFSHGRVSQGTLPSYKVTVTNPSCFVAGTSVLGISGPMAIEDIRPGDLILAQDVHTGRLTYRPVLETTRRREFPVFKIRTVDDDELVATGGHAFWVAGTGWIRARDLASGMRLHTLRGGVCVSDVEAGPPRRSYNLVVADFHSYFVGEGNILCHDNTLFAPTNAVLPGLHEN
jgi:hypothetical protein